MTWERLLSLQEVVILFTAQAVESTKRISFDRRLSIASHCHLALVISLLDNIDRRQSLNMLHFSWNHKRVWSLVLSDIESLIKFPLMLLLALDFEPLHIVALLVPFCWVRPRIRKLKFGPGYITTELTFPLLVPHFGEETGFGCLIFVLVVLTDPLAFLINLVIPIRHLILDKARRGLIHLLEFKVTTIVIRFIWRLVSYRH